jgi:hypothetical protein
MADTNTYRINGSKVLFVDPNLNRTVLSITQPQYDALKVVFPDSKFLYEDDEQRHSLSTYVNNKKQTKLIVKYHIVDVLVEFRTSKKENIYATCELVKDHGEEKRDIIAINKAKIMTL